MKVLKRLFCLSVLCSVLTATAAAAASDSAGNRFDIAGNVIADQTVNGDYVAFGQSVKLESGVAGDIIAGGRTVVITDEGEVQNIFAAGQNITVHARSVRNLYAAGADISVTAGSRLGGGYLVGGTVSFGGTADEAYLAGVSVTADGTVSGNMTIRSDHITFGRNAAVGGRLTIISTVKPQLPPNIDPAKVTYKRVMNSAGQKPPSERGISRFKVIMAASAVVTAALIAVLMTLLCSSYFAARAGEFRKRAWKDVLVGTVGIYRGSNRRLGVYGDSLCHPGEYPHTGSLRGCALPVALRRRHHSGTAASAEAEQVFCICSRRRNRPPITARPGPENRALSALRFLHTRHHRRKT